MYYDIARADAQKYYKRLREGKEDVRERKKRARVDETGDDESSSSISAFDLYNDAVRKRFKQLNPRATSSEISRLIGVGWRNLPSAQKRPFEELAKQDEERAALGSSSSRDANETDSQHHHGSEKKNDSPNGDVDVAAASSSETIQNKIALVTTTKNVPLPGLPPMTSHTLMAAAATTTTTRQQPPQPMRTDTTKMPTPFPPTLGVSSARHPSHAFMSPPGSMPHHPNLQRFMATIGQRSPPIMQPLDPVMFMKQMRGVRHPISMPAAPWTLPLPFPPPRSPVGLHPHVQHGHPSRSEAAMLSSRHLAAAGQHMMMPQVPMGRQQPSQNLVVQSSVSPQTSSANNSLSSPSETSGLRGGVRVGE